MPRILFALVVSLGLWAQAVPQPWLRAPSLDHGPEVEYRFREEGKGLRLDFRPEKVDLTKWMLHFWLGDPQIVEARQKHLAEIRSAIQNAEALLKEPNHKNDFCQGSLHAFLGKAFVARANFRQFDPYAHVRLRFPSQSGWLNDGLPFVQLAPGTDETGAAMFSAVIPFTGQFHAASDPVSNLSYGFSYLLREKSSYQPGLQSPQVVPLQKPWRLEPLFASRTARVRFIQGQPDQGQIYIPDHEGYLFGRLGLAEESACYGAEGRFTAPAPWSPWPRESEVQLPARSDRFRFSFIGGRGSRLAVQVVRQEGVSLPNPKPFLNSFGIWVVTQRDPIVLDLKPYLDSLGEYGIKMLDCVETPTNTFLILEVEGESRPGAGPTYCGAGVEGNLIWLNLGPSGTLIKAVTHRISSCFESIQAVFKKDTKNGIWNWQWEFYRKHEAHTLRYDPKHPEFGLIEDIEPMKETDFPVPLKSRKAERKEATKSGS